jgi:hypothetical protein
MMLVRLTTKLADVVDGVDVSQCSEGDVIELSQRDATLLIAERWAEPVDSDVAARCEVVGRMDVRAVAADRPRRGHSDDNAA